MNSRSSQLWPTGRWPARDRPRAGRRLREAAALRDNRAQRVACLYGLSLFASLIGPGR